MTNGYDTSERTMKAPQKPLSQGSHEIQAKADKYEGIASDNESKTSNRPRGRIPESTNAQPAIVPITAEAAVTHAANTTLRVTTLNVDERKISCIAVFSPLATAVSSKYQSGTRLNTADTTAGTKRDFGTRRVELIL
jgi:hypothetical protein